MNIDAFLTCLGYYGVATGVSANLEGVYSPSSGTTGYLYNQIYATGLHVSGGLIYSPVLPLINVGTPLQASNGFTATQSLRVGYQHSGNFGVFMDIEYSGCLRAAGRGNILLSTVDSPAGLASGFAIGINDRNRLFFKTQNKGYTLTKELATHDLVYVALTENQYVTFGLYKLDENKLYSKSVALDSGNFSTNSIYFGGFLNNSGYYTGYSGKINQIVLLNDGLSNQDVGSCSQCSLVTGYTVSPLVNSFSGSQITGYYFSGIQTIGNTGYATLTGQVQRADGSFVSVLYQSGISGFVTSGSVVTPLLGTVALQTTGFAYNFLSPQSTINSFVRRSVEFDIPLSSGDIIEINTYPVFNSRVNYRASGNVWPDTTGYVQLIGNGLAETSGVDYWVTNNTISGFNAEDILSYDVLNTGSIVTSYSGYWLQSHTLMSGGSFFPPTAQYYENTGFSGQVKITGLSGISTGNAFYPTFGYDLYMNGQKLISGLQYDVAVSGSGFVVSLSGSNLPLLNTNLLYGPTGGLPTGYDGYDDNELSFIPQFSGFQRQRFDITGDVTNIGSITGYSPQVWVNGVRQYRNIDYFLHDTCDFLTGNYDSPSTEFTCYRSDTDEIGLWNFPLMPYINVTDIDVSSDGPQAILMDLTFATTTYNNSYAISGLYAEVLLTSNLGNFIVGRVNPSLTTGEVRFDNNGSIVNLTGTCSIRYRNNNVIGAWGNSSSQFVASFI